MKKEKIFIDTDVFLDTIPKGEPHFEYSNKIIELCEQGELEGCTSALVIANIFYIVNRLTTHKEAMQSIGKIHSLIKILPLTDKEIGESINSGFKDFEDGVQYFVCVNGKITNLITRNVKDFKKANISVMSPEGYLKSIPIQGRKG